jgi:hypothetical protein
MALVGGNPSANTGGTFGDKTTLHQFLSRLDKLVGFDGLRLHPRHKAIHTFLQRYQGLKPELRLNGSEVRKCMANVPQSVLAGNDGMCFASKMLAQKKSDLCNRTRAAGADIQGTSIRCPSTQSESH